MINFFLPSLLFHRLYFPASRDRQTRVVVVTGDPRGRAFCAGADLNSDANAFAPSFPDLKSSTGRETGERKRMAVDSFRDSGGFSSLAALRCTKVSKNSEERERREKERRERERE